jgi:hypothetical protein
MEHKFVARKSPQEGRYTLFVDGEEFGAVYRSGTGGYIAAIGRCEIHCPDFRDAIQAARECWIEKNTATVKAAESDGWVRDFLEGAWAYGIPDNPSQSGRERDEIGVPAFTVT